MLLILSYAPCSTSCSNKLRSTSSRCGSSRSYLFVVTTKIQMTRPSNRFVTHYFRRTISWSVSCKDANENRGTKSSAALNTLVWVLKKKSTLLGSPKEKCVFISCLIIFTAWIDFQEKKSKVKRFYAFFRPLWTILESALICLRCKT